MPKANITATGTTTTTTINQRWMRETVEEEQPPGAMQTVE
jgi:hypothetical protein